MSQMNNDPDVAERPLPSATVGARSISDGLA